MIYVNHYPEWIQPRSCNCSHGLEFVRLSALYKVVEAAHRLLRVTDGGMFDDYEAYLALADAVSEVTNE